MVMINLSELSRLGAMAERAEGGDLAWVGIFAPDFGEREDVPNILLPEAYTAENRNVLLLRGEIQRMKMRLPELLEAEFALGTLTAVNASKTVTVSGGAGVWGTSATHKPYWTGRKIQIYDDAAWHEYVIDTVANDGATLTLTVVYAETGGAGKQYKIGTAGEPVQTPDGNPILRYHRLVTSTAGTEYLMVFTKAHAYLWSTSWTAFILKFTCGSDCEAWSVVDMNNEIIATNNVDKIQTWGATIGNAFAPLDSSSGIDIGAGVYLTAAHYLTVYEGYVIAADVTVGGTHRPFDMFWSTHYDATDWDQTGLGDAGDLTILEGGRYRGFGQYSGFLIVAKETQMYRVWLVTTDEVFNQDVELPNVGCLAAETIINDREGRLYWLATDFTIREWRSGIVSQAKDKTLKNVNPQLAGLSKAGFIDEYNQVWFSLPVGAAATANNTVLTLDGTGAKWGQLDIAVAAFGDYTRQSVYTWTTLPFAAWTEWAWKSWAGPENVLGFPLDLASDYSGYTYDLHSAEKDNGSDYTGYAVLSTDLAIAEAVKRYGKSLTQYKRLAKAVLFTYRETGGQLAFEVKRDNEPNWQNAGTVPLADETEQADIVRNEIDPDMRARHFLLKISAASPFRFVGLMLGFIADGER